MDPVCHFEVPFDEKERMEKFYADVFGWQFHSAPGGVPYTFAFTCEVDEQFKPTTPGRINGGSYQRTEAMASAPVLVLEVESCEQRIKDVEAAGGSKITAPVQVGDMGIYAQVKDTEGNIIGIWQQLGPSSESAPNENPAD